MDSARATLPGDESGPILTTASSGADAMRTTLVLDDDLVAAAEAYTGLIERSDLVHEAMKALVEREAARRLASMGGSQPEITAVPRRRGG